MSLGHVFAITKNGLGRAHAVLQTAVPLTYRASSAQRLAVESHRSVHHPSYDDCNGHHSVQLFFG